MEILETVFLTLLYLLITTAHKAAKSEEHYSSLQCSAKATSDIQRQAEQS